MYAHWFIKSHSGGNKNSQHRRAQPRQLQHAVTIRIKCYRVGGMEDSTPHPNFIKDKQWGFSTQFLVRELNNLGTRESIDNKKNEMLKQISLNVSKVLMYCSLISNVRIQFPDMLNPVFEMFTCVRNKKFQLFELFFGFQDMTIKSFIVFTLNLKGCLWRRLFIISKCVHCFRVQM